MIVLAVLLASGIQILLTNQALSRVILEANGRLFDRIAEQTKHQLNSHYSTAFTALGGFSKAHNINSTVKDERDQVIPEVAHLLSEFPHVSAYSFYYPDGDLLSVKRVNNDAFNSTLSLAPRSKFVVAKRIANQTEVFTLDSSLERFETLDSDDINLKKLNDRFSDAIVEKKHISPPTLLTNSKSLGVNIYRKSLNGTIIITEVSLRDLQLSLSDTLMNKSSIRVLYNDDGYIFAMSDGANVGQHGQTLNLENIRHKIVPHAITHNDEKKALDYFDYEKERWFGRIVTIKPLNSEHIHLLMATKASDLFDNASLMKQHTLAVSLLSLLIFLPCIYLISNLLSKPIIRVTKRAKEMEAFRFNSLALPHSYIKEIQELNHAQMSTQATIQRFITLTDSIARNDNLENMIKLVCRNTAYSVGAKGVFLYLLDAEKQLLKPKYVWWEGVEDEDSHYLSTESIATNEKNHFIQKIFINKQPHIFKLDELPLISITHENDYEAEVVFIPLKNRAGEVIGSFGLVYENCNTSDLYKQYSDYLEALLGYTSVAIETYDMIEAQRTLLDSFIQVFASSLDKKSPYTGHHCKRVPVITRWLTEAAQESNLAPFEQFNLDTKGWEELDMASWLHDCGKITTPEHVVDKATKLESIYNRIHEIRMRFEVLKRDNEIALFHQSFGELPQEDLKALHTYNQEITDDFNFIASLNLGKEFLNDKDLQRLKQISEQTWVRTLSKTVGISWVEKQRHEMEDRIPQQEKLLSDLPEHIVKWDFPPANEERFTMKQTEHQGNLGEVYNLSIRRGTLTEEERFIINDHIVQTIHILESLPFPKHMQNVAKIAGAHHEKVNGSGYPMGLTGDQMPLTAKIMAIADVFEALTSADRPYKKAKSLSESI